MIPRALTIAGSDSGGGAGIQADLKTFQALGVFGTSAITLVTAQNTLGVQDIHLLPQQAVIAQIDSVLSDIGTSAIKTGAIGSAPLIRAVARRLTSLPPDIPIVVDPVMVSRHGDLLLPTDAIEALRTELLPRATVLTPNIHEAAALLGWTPASVDDMARAAEGLTRLGPAAVVVKGGGLDTDPAVDVLHAGGETLRFEHPRIESRHTHGTGCIFAAAICALLARGEALSTAVAGAGLRVARAISAAPGIGGGHGPVGFAALGDDIAAADAIATTSA